MRQIIYAKGALNHATPYSFEMKKEGESYKVMLYEKNIFVDSFSGATQDEALTKLHEYLEIKGVYQG